MYYIEVFDSLGCNFVDSIYVDGFDVLNVDFGGFTNPLICNGSETIINSVISGGTSPFDILWNNSETSSQVVVGAGLYILDVIDTNGCTASSSINIIEPDSFYVIGSFIPATCNQMASASISTYGGTNPVTFLWSNGDTNSTASGFDGGDHWVIATDSCGNTSIYEFTVIEYILETSIYHTNNPDNY